MIDKERLKYQNRYSHLHLHFAHKPGWDKLTLASAILLDSEWPRIPFWLKHLWDNAVNNGYRYTNFARLLIKLGINPDTPNRFTQIKEKFGGLCLYTSGNYCTQAIHVLETRSYRICETCGDYTEGTTTREFGWYHTCCKNCYLNTIKPDDIKLKYWKERTI